MEENEAPSNYELANSLPPVDQMDRGSAQAEIARMNTDQNGPLWNEFNLDHRAAVLRLQRLLERVQITPAEKEAAAKQNKKALDERIAGLQEKNQEQAAQEAENKAESALQMRWGSEWETNLAQLQGFVESNLSEEAKAMLETPNARGICLGDDPEFILDLHALLEKYGVK
jgi:hypothetical protein